MQIQSSQSSPRSQSSAAFLLFQNVGSEHCRVFASQMLSFWQFVFLLSLFALGFEMLFGRLNN